MIIESGRKHGFCVIHIQQENVDDTDFSPVESLVEKHAREGDGRIAVSMGMNVYPYSKLISVLVRCNKLVQDQGGTLAVVQPNPDFLDWRYQRFKKAV